MKRFRFYRCMVALQVMLLSFLFWVPGYADSRDQIKKLESGLARSSGTDRLDILSQLCPLYLTLGEHKQAVRYGDEALQLARDMGDESVEAGLLLTVSWIYMEMGDYHAALEHISHARDLFRRLNMAPESAGAFYVTATIYWRLTDYQKAQHFALEAWKASEKLGDKEGQANALSMAGLILFDLGNDSEALEYYNRALELFKELDYQPGIATMLNNIAVVLKQRGLFDAALSNYQQSLVIEKKLGSRMGVANTLTNIANVYETLKDFQKALDFNSRALAIYRGTDARAGISHTLINIGRVNRLLGHLKLGALQVLKGLESAERMGAGKIMVNGYKELVINFSAQGDFQQALAFLKKQKIQGDAILKQSNNRLLTEMQTRFDVEKKIKEIKLLEKDKFIRQSALIRQRNVKNFLLVISGLFLLVGVVLYGRYRFGVRASAALRREMAERRRAEEELLKSMKLEAVGIMAGGMAHDFNNLLSVFMDSIHPVKKRLPLNSAGTSLLKNAETAANKAADLAGKLIAFSEEKGP